jgi:hypothetical protein
MLAFYEALVRYLPLRRKSDVYFNKILLSVIAFLPYRVDASAVELIT